MEVLTLPDLCSIYKDKLGETDFANPNYRGEKLMHNLVMDQNLGHQLLFTKVNPTGFNNFYLVVNKGITTGQAVGKAYVLAGKDNIKDVAETLRGIIKRACKDSKELQWPPKPEDLEVKSGVIPELLESFLCLLTTGKSEPPSEPAERLIFSIRQDIFRAVSNGEVKMPKHILMCMTMRHMFRSKKLITILNRLGHCESNWFGIEVENSIEAAIDESSSWLNPDIVNGPENKVFHTEWDNHDQKVAGIHGPASYHSAAGILCQETNDIDDPPERPPLKRFERKQVPKKRRIEEKLSPFHVNKKARVGPVIRKDTNSQTETQNEEAFKKGLKVYTVWSFCRKASSTAKQCVPALGGFISKTGIPPKKKTVIANFQMIPEPITQDNVVKELLKRTAEATDEVGQRYAITTFDLGVVMKACPIIWIDPSTYENHIVLIGSFHAIMNYLKMIGHKMKGSGYSEIIAEATLVTSGCINGVLSGKLYSKSLWCLKVVSEALERLLILSFLDQRCESEDDNDRAYLLASLIKNLDRDNLKEVIEDPVIQSYISDYEKFQDDIRSGSLGKTAMFWLSFLDHARRVFMLLYAVKINDLRLFHKCMGDMADLFFAFGGQNYARYLTWFDAFLTNLDLSHPGANNLLEKGAIAVARSAIPGNLCPVDKTMEEEVMKSLKSGHGAGGAGLTGILGNEKSYQRMIVTTGERAKFYNLAMEMVGIIKDSDHPKNGQHRETFKSEIKKSEHGVQKVLDAIKGFINPFNVDDKNHLYILSSGAPVPLDVEVDVLRAEAAGREAKDNFMKQRIYKVAAEHNKDFFYRITRMKLKTMGSTNKSIKLTSDQGKRIQYQEQGDILITILLKSQLLSNPISIDELMTYALTPVPHCIGTPDGFMAKTDKAKLMHYHVDETEDAEMPQNLSETVFVEDGNAVLHAMKGLPNTVKELVYKIVQQTKLNTTTIFSTDSYKDDSPKSQEQLRRGSGQKMIINFNTRLPEDFNYFLKNKDNKVQLFQVMLDVLSQNEAAYLLHKRNFILIVNGEAFQLKSDGTTVCRESISSINSTQEETDTRVVLYLMYAKEQKYKQAVVRSPDSDILFILLFYAHQFPTLVVLFDTGRGDNRRLINISELASELSPRYCEAILGLYCFTGEDCNCAFKGKGKIGPLKKLLKKQKFMDTFINLGRSWKVTEQTIKELEEFTCYMYALNIQKSVDKARADMLRKVTGGKSDSLKHVKKVDLSRFPPCKRSLTPHIRRVNYRVSQWKHSHIPSPDIPSPTDGHGWKIEGEFLEPVWSDGPILPSSLYDIVDKTQSSDGGEDSTDDEDDGSSPYHPDSDGSSSEDSDID